MFLVTCKESFLNDQKIEEVSPSSHARPLPPAIRLIAIYFNRCRRTNPSIDQYVAPSHPKHIEETNRSMPKSMCGQFSPPRRPVAQRFIEEEDGGEDGIIGDVYASENEDLAFEYHSAHRSALNCHRGEGAPLIGEKIILLDRPSRQ